jgi:hypothetical protein
LSLRGLTIGSVTSGGTSAKGGQVYGELEGGGRTDAAPAAALVGPNHNYLFVLVKGLDVYVDLNQGELGKPFVGWP